MKIYYLGPRGSYSYIMAKKLYPREQLVAKKNFTEIVKATRKDSQGRGLLPIENIIVGKIRESEELIKRYAVKIREERWLPIKLNLIGWRGATLQTIKKVFSHPKALEQSKVFLDKYHIEGVGVESTSRGQELVLKKQKKEWGAIGSEVLIDKRLVIIKENIGDRKDNRTKFAVIQG